MRKQAGSYQVLQMIAAQIIILVITIVLRVTLTSIFADIGTLNTTAKIRSQKSRLYVCNDSGTGLQKYRKFQKNANFEGIFM